jgi:hypothetical protein
MSTDVLDPFYSSEQYEEIKQTFKELVKNIRSNIGLRISIIDDLDDSKKRDTERTENNQTLHKLNEYVLLLRYEPDKMESI